MGRGGIKTETIENSVVPLGGNQFETGLITVPANSMIKKGVLLKREGGKFAPVTNTAPATINADVNGSETSIPLPGIPAEIPVAVNPFDVPNHGSAAADLSIRALISGPVRADLLTVAGVATTDDQNDMLRNYGIIPIKVNDVSRTE
jgi:hypothetical protein